MSDFTNFYQLESNQVLEDIGGSKEGLSQKDAEERLRKYGSKIHRQSKQWKSFLLLLGQFKSPIMLILIFAAILSIFLGDKTDAIIILIIIGIRDLLSFWQEHRAADAVEKLLGIFAINVFLHKPILDSFLFSLALAIGLTPQLLPWNPFPKK